MSKLQQILFILQRPLVVEIQLVTSVGVVDRDF